MFTFFENCVKFILNCVKLGMVMVLIGIMFLIVSVPFVMLGGGYEPEFKHGKITGVISSVENTGMIWESWEGTLVIEGAQEADDLFDSKKFYVNIPDEVTLNQIMTAYENKTSITIQYSRWFIRPMQIGSRYVVRGIE